jgi:cyclopropane fatty-acyl-phospholipid synthase-like methyltransferase
MCRLTDVRAARCSWPMAEDVDFAQRYAQSNIPWDSGKPSKELIRVLKAAKLTGQTALEIGCGTGTNAIELARHGFKVTAVDSVEQAISIAHGKAGDAQVSVDFRVADVLTQNLGGPYDVLFDRGVYHVLRMVDLAKFQNLLKRVSRRGSWYLSLAGNSKETKIENGPPVVSEQEIRAELGPLFDIMELREFRFSTNQSGFHPLAWSILMRRK